MSESKSESKKKPTAAVDVEAAEPVHTIRVGAVSASIWRRQSTSGFAYYDFSLSRSWQSMSTNKTGHSKSFFTRSCAELLEVIKKACAWIKEQEQADFVARGSDSAEGASDDARA
jgi:hypothetical protein